MTPTTTRRALLAGAAASLAVPRAVPARVGNVLRWSSEGEVIGWDPHATMDAQTKAMVIDHVHEGLTRLGHSVQVEPSLATSWRLAEPTIWEFELREGVRFHDGTPLTPADVVFSLDRARGAELSAETSLEYIARVEAAAGSTVRITTHKPDPMLPVRLRMVGIVSEGWIRAHGVPTPGGGQAAGDSFAHEHANGTGPFRLVESHIPDSFALERNPGWWGLADRPVEV